MKSLSHLFERTTAEIEYSDAFVSTASIIIEFAGVLLLLAGVVRILYVLFSRSAKLLAVLQLNKRHFRRLFGIKPKPKDSVQEPFQCEQAGTTASGKGSHDVKTTTPGEFAEYLDKNMPGPEHKVIPPGTIHWKYTVTIKAEEEQKKENM